MQAGSGTILLVNADQLEATDLQAAMRHQGVANPVTLLRDATAALAHLATSEGPPALVLVDVDLPATGGLALIAALRDSRDHAVLPVFVITEARHSTACHAAEGMGVAGFVDRRALARMPLDQLLVEAARQQERPASRLGAATGPDQVAERQSREAPRAPRLLLVEASEVDARAVVWALRRQRVINRVDVVPDALTALRQLRASDADSAPLVLLDLDRPLPGVVALLRAGSQGEARILGLSSAPESLPPPVRAGLSGTINKARIGEDFRKALQGVHAYWQAVFLDGAAKRELSGR